MSLASKNAARSCVRFLHLPSALKGSTTYLRRRCPLREKRWTSTNTVAPKICGIVDQISQLTLLETADLVSSLKSRLNIPDIPIGGLATSAPATPAATPVEEEEAAPVKHEKTLFNLKLESFDATSKPKIIKEIKGMLGLSLVDSKKFVESAPKIMREGVPKEEAEKIVAALKALGGVVTME